VFEAMNGVRLEDLYLVETIKPKPHPNKLVLSEHQCLVAMPSQHREPNTTLTLSDELLVRRVM